MKTKMVFALAAAMGLIWLVAASAEADDKYRRQTIVNNSDSNANDLHIVFDYNVWGAKVRPKDQPPGHDGDGTGSGEFGMCGRTWDFAPPNTFGTVGPGGVAYLDYHHSCPLGPVNIDASQSYFTLDGNALAGFTRQGRQMAISRNAFYEPTAVRITNETAGQLTYQNVQVVKDNSLLNWTIDTYFLPTGVPEAALPTTFTLNPGEEMVLPISSTTPYTYVLVTMESYPTGAPAELALDYLGARSGPPDAILSYNCVTDQLVMDTGVNVLNGFIIHSPDGEFTGLAALPPGFEFNTNTPEMMASQLGGILAGLHDFGPGAVNRGLLWNAAEGRWDCDDWSFTYTVDGVESTFHGDIELTGSLPGDADQDGDVDAWDIQQILAANRYLTGSMGTWEHGDFNGDGFVDYADIEMILDHGMYDAGAAPMLLDMIPEPTTFFVLLVAGLPALLKRRRRLN